MNTIVSNIVFFNKQKQCILCKYHFLFLKINNILNKCLLHQKKSTVFAQKTLATAKKVKKFKKRMIKNKSVGLKPCVYQKHQGLSNHLNSHLVKMRVKIN